jgi:hypothetical protein
MRPSFAAEIRKYTYEMKKILFLLMIVGLSSFRSMANPGETIPASARTSFEKMFASAREVAWSQAEAYYRADFLFNGQYVQAYYSCSGTLIAMKKNILSTQLPLALEVSLRQNYSQFWITNVEEVSNEDGVYYIATLENGSSKVQLKSITTSWFQLHNSRK